MLRLERERPITRWGGRLTKRPLPDHDETIALLSDEDRRGLSSFWLARSSGERRVSDAMVVIRDALEKLGQPAELVELAERAIDDELRHAQLWQLGARRFALDGQGTAEHWPPFVPHYDAPDELRYRLYVVAECVLNETTASTFLQTCLRQARGPLAVAVLRELLSDEIDHGRIGWAFLARLSGAQRDELQPWLVPMLRAHWNEWTRALYDVPDSYAAHGIPSKADTGAAIVASLRDVIFPGLKEQGFATTGMEEWLDETVDKG
jgi:hypothetical protein